MRVERRERRGLPSRCWPYLRSGVFTFVLVLAGCQYLPFGFTDIGEIVASPVPFEGREVKIRGTVVDVTKIPLIEIKNYMLKDETGSIIIFTQGTLPKMGQTVAVRGQVQSTLILAGKGFGLTVKEIAKLDTLQMLWSADARGH